MRGLFGKSSEPSGFKGGAYGSEVQMAATCRVPQRSLPAPVLCSACVRDWIRGICVLSAGFQTMLKQETRQYAGDHAGEMGQTEPHEVQSREAPSPALVRNNPTYRTV